MSHPYPQGERPGWAGGQAAQQLLWELGKEWWAASGGMRAALLEPM